MGSISQGTDRLILAPAARRDAVLQLMRSANRALVLSMLRCDDFSIVDELASAVKRGVDVRILYNEDHDQPIPVPPPPETNIVADDGPALVTSLNFTRKCFETTCDFMVLSDDPQIVSGLKALFKNDCAAPVAGPLPEMPERLIIGPEQSRERLTQIISDAASSIRIIDHRVTDPEMLALLAAKARQGLTVQIAGTGPMGGLICHGRMILVDQKTAIIGSIHLSRPSLDLRREVAIVVEEPGVVAQLYDYFQHLAINDENLMNLWAAPPISPEDEDDEEDE